MEQSQRLMERLESYIITPGDTVYEAGLKVFELQFENMQQKESGTIMGDIESLHEMRVATRRLRVATKLFGGYYSSPIMGIIKDGLKITGKVLGRMRDFDILIVRLDQFIGSRDFFDGPQYFALRTEVRNRQVSEREKMRGYLQSNAYLKFKDIFIYFLSTPEYKQEIMNQTMEIHQFVRNSIDVKMAEVLSHVYLEFPSAAKRMHKLRIAAKELRYSLEFFHEIIGKDVWDKVIVLTEIQDHLGQINDIYLTLEIMNGLLSLDYEIDCSLIDVIREFKRVNNFELNALIDTFPGIWCKFKDPNNSLVSSLT